jgi:hypothetical protein
MEPSREQRLQEVREAHAFGECPVCFLSGEVRRLEQALRAIVDYHEDSEIPDQWKGGPMCTIARKALGLETWE